eukprot:TRINITY_DN804_c0_g1_i7.p2 TRINITY_DN804_c0_g1~~TRINITY_DN804_c0_g1_i7.p2  ORF type:complete len:100 (+),score=0.18 TRINITY_DN804_c0_g1_i7:290-589(+)
MVTHVNKVASSCFYYLYNIRRIRKYLTRHVCETQVTQWSHHDLIIATAFFTAILPNSSFAAATCPEQRSQTYTSFTSFDPIISSPIRPPLVACVVPNHL